MEIETDRREKANERWLLAATIVVVVCYAWLAAYLLEPKIPVPSFVQSISWQEDQSLHPIASVKGKHWPDINQLTRELARLEPELSVLGGVKLPLILIIDSDHPQKYAVTDRIVYIGREIAREEGQLTKAVIKAWLMQSASPVITSSVLRVEVISDVLLGIVRGKFSLGIPGSESSLQFPEVKDYLSISNSYAASCESEWRVYEINHTCGESSAINPLAYRSFLGSVVWRHYLALPTLARLSFVNAWISSIRSPSATTVANATHALPNSLLGWREWLRNEIAVLVPNAPSKTLLVGTGLIETDVKPLEVALYMRWSEADDSQVAEFLSQYNKRNQSKKVVIEANGHTYLFPGMIELSRSEKLGLTAKTVVWDSCSSPSVREVLHDPIQSDRTLYLRACRDRDVKQYLSLLDLGVESFALKNPGVAFVQLRRSGLQLAIRRTLIKPTLPVSNLIEKPEENVADALGLKQARWEKKLDAYQVVGAIEAVEWFRRSSVL